MLRRQRSDENGDTMIFPRMSSALKPSGVSISATMRRSVSNVGGAACSIGVARSIMVVTVVLRVAWCAVHGA
ncbi:hypothetical protein AB0C86_25195 [Streptomyces lavendulae]|uniref:hypothetical protein n=1 Tax=Streptomyces lavendulae TaxID=1914 RepID=UPI0033C78822